MKQWNDTNHIRSRADVELYRNDWEHTLENIIIDLNQFFLNGDIYMVHHWEKLYLIQS